MREPDFGLGIAQAWRMDMGSHMRDEQRGTLVGYALKGPFHPAWDWWMVSVIHLREIPGVKSPHKQYPEAEYEFMIVSLHPDTPPNVDEPFPQDVQYLTPIDVVVQFHGVTDQDAIAICDDAVRAICEGAASPDQDWRTWWKNAIAKTVEHYRAGMHGSRTN